jgi:APA family basic amino acid/polyamine antiporter
MKSQDIGLRRALSLPLITFYGLGTILGAGIYVLVGEVAGVAGMYAPISFVAAALVAAFTAFTYAELSARHPLSGGEAIYVQEALGHRGLSTFVGALIVFAGLVSSATLANGFVRYLGVFVQLPDTLVIVVVITLLGALALWGILESATVAAIATLIEIVGLVLIVVVCRESFLDLPARLPELFPPFEAGAWWSISLGAFLAFYAFIGFEDMVNVAEEVKDPQRTMPKAIILALVGATVLYFLVVMVAVLSLPPSTLAGHGAPLALLFETATGSHPAIITLISLFAVINGALIQIIMATRMLFGMARAGWLIAPLARVSGSTRTPVVATVVITIGVMVFAVWLPLITLARLTSFAILLVFVLVNVSLIRIKKLQHAPSGVRVYPLWVPYTGLSLALVLLLFQVVAASGMVQ